jgi:deoxycytidylate deaminase
MKDRFVGKYMRLARQIATDDNPCLSRQVGVVVVDPSTNGIVGAGYNGPPEGTPHCNDVEFLQNFFWPRLTLKEKDKLNLIMMESSWWWNRSSTMPRKEELCEYVSSCNACPRNVLGYSCGERADLCSCQHAERNALNKLAVPAKDLVMFCWCGVPCIQCTGSIINAGIKELYCLKQIEDYHPEARWLYEKSRTSLIEFDEAALERSK